MRVETLMTTPVLGILPSASIGEAIRTMLSRRISGLPVIDESGALVGIVSEGDLILRGEFGTESNASWWTQLLKGSGQLASEYVRAYGRRVSDVMTTDVQTIPPGAPIAEAVKLMQQHRIKRLPVVEGGRVIGILSRADLLAELDRLITTPQPTPDDNALKAAIEKSLATRPWGGLIDVQVKAGEVHLTGTIFDDRERRAAIVLAENAPGVKKVVDDLVWMEPISGTVLAP
ncbi:CBS domain-containing protein [Segnochrobactrum spirostomi]|uniref:CBS domain-containing protein n=1 Tax=Segnochrobactrum spirostomi TaxID=2608987 RepID=A0A6A7Y0Y3_9HYPH|nr:CBS domain-containing protein [Segnochrobactrum spirostomi]MQT12624.1 CBS domain-containing protein [Segnochrobactrum spirostomi]